MPAAPLEFEAGAGDEVAHGPGDEHLARMSKRGDTCSDADCDAGRLAIVELALADVDPDSGVEPQVAKAGEDRLAGTDRPRGPVEGGEEAVPSGVALLAAEERQLPAYKRMVAGEQLPPRLIAERRDSLRRADQVSEHQRRQDARRS